jgi:small subunit ribosomal protein S3Ae
MARRAVTKGKKKNWYTIVAPKVFNEVEVGETSAYDVNDVIGRTVKASLMNFTRNIKKQSITVTLALKEVKDKKAFTEVSSYSTSPSAVKRLVRRRRDKVDDSFIALTSDGKKVRVKPMVLTRSNTSNSTLTALRHAVRYTFISEIKKMTYGQFVDSVIADKIARDIKSSLSFIYPVRMVSVRAFKVEENPKTAVTQLTASDKAVFNQISEKKAEKQKRFEKKRAAAAEKAAESAPAEEKKE